MLESDLIQSNKPYKNQKEILSFLTNKSETNSKLKFLFNKIKWIYLLRVKDLIFDIYKQNILKNELEELKIYNIKPKESHEVLVLKEKYVIKTLFLTKIINLGCE